MPGSSAGPCSSVTAMSCAAFEDGMGLDEQLIRRLADVPTPEGPTLRQLADQGVSILPALVRRLSRDDLQESSRPTSVKPKE